MSLLAWYPLISNGNNQGLDGVNLTTTGTVTYTAGKLGNAATFTGSNANRMTRSLFSENKNLSFCAWVKITELPTTWSYFFTNGRADAVSDGWGIGVNSSGNIRFCFGSSTPISTHTVLTTTVWYHVALTIDENKVMRYYIDGVEVGNMTVSTLPDYSESQYFCIGAFQYNNGYIYPLNGQVQDFRYYNHVLSAKEVKEIAKGLCVHYQLKGAGAGANLLYNSATLFNDTGWSWNPNACTVSKAIEDDDTVITGKRMKIQIINPNDTDKGVVGPYIRAYQFGQLAGPLISGKKYTYSFYAKADSSNTADISLLPGSVCENKTINSYTGFGNLTTSWRKHTVTCTYTGTGGMTSCFYITAPANKTTILYIAGLKMEEGEVATSWIPHVYDSAYTTYGIGRKSLPYTVVGSPTNNTGLFSNFSASNYINTGLTFNPGTSPWEVTTRIVTGSDITTIQHIEGCNNTTRGALFGIWSDSTVHLWLSNNGTTFDIKDSLGGLAVTASTNYWFKYGWTGTQYYIKRSTDGGNTYTTDVTFDSTTAIHSCPFYVSNAFALSSNYFKGSIDMEAFKITVNGNTIYDGSVGIVNAIEPDCSGFGNNGTVNGRVSTVNSSPRYMSCENMDQTSSYISSLNGFPLSSTMPDFTMNFWFKPKQGVTFNAYSDVVRIYMYDMPSTTRNLFLLRLGVDNTAGTSYRWFYNYQTGQEERSFGYSTAIATNAWKMITLTIDSSKNYKCYLNGTQYASGTLSSAFIPAGTTGQFWVCDNANMFGSYSDFRLYATCLSADDIKELYQTSASIDKSGDMHTYEFVEE